MKQTDGSTTVLQVNITIEDGQVVIKTITNVRTIGCQQETQTTTSSGVTGMMIFHACPSAATPPCSPLAANRSIAA